MLKKNLLTTAVHTALGLATAMTVLPALAQEESEQLEEVVVTGSRIQRANMVTSSPVQQLDAEQLAFTGVTRLEDALVALPQISLDQSSGQAIESIGTATLELRGLGSSRTLVLLNGRRLPTNSPADTESGADINFIPSTLIKRIEVLTGGASSTYGADAVAGVVNFIMIDDFEGVKFDYQYSAYRHDNSGGDVFDAAERIGFDTISGTVNDGDTDNWSFVIGGNLNEGRGNVTAYATYREIDGVTQSERDTSLCAVGTVGGDCGGSGTNESGSFYFENDNYDALYHVEGNEFVAGGGEKYNYAPPSYSQRPDERYNLGAMAHYELNEHVEVYTELMFMDTRSIAQFGPAGVFYTGNSINCGNPLLSAQQMDVMGCTGDPDQIVESIFGRRNAEGGARFGDMRHSTYRGLFGLRGDINETWSYDVSYQYAEVDMRVRNGNYLNTARADNSLKATTDDAGNTVCINDDGGFCVPWDIFSTGGVEQDQINYYSQQYFVNGQTEQTVAQGFVQGNLGDYGWNSPWAEEGIIVVLGAEYRKETLVYQPDDSALAGEVGGLGAALTPVDGKYSVNDIFGEASIPLIEGRTLVQDLTMDLGYRYSDYDPSGETTDTYKIAMAWELNDQVKLRASYQRAVRAPNVVDQFQPVQGTLFSMDNDPCGGVVNGRSQRGYSFEQCARSGVSASVWANGGPKDSPANQYNSIIGGSTELSPEESDTNSLGAIWTPGFIDGLSVSVDWYNIDVQDAISTISDETTLLQCIETGSFCEKVGRGTNDSLWLGLAGPGNGIDAKTQNIGFFEVTGIDLELNYNLDMQSWGSLLINNVYGYVDEWKQQEYAGAEVQNCEGVYGGSCELPRPENANRFAMTWATPWNVSANLTWRYIDSVDQIGQPSDDPGHTIDEQNYIDLAATWNVTDYATLRIGMNNVADEDAPQVPNGVTLRENGNTYPGVYDPLGQYWFAGVTVQF